MVSRLANTVNQEVLFPLLIIVYSQIAKLQSLLFNQPMILDILSLADCC